MPSRNLNSESNSLLTPPRSGKQLTICIADLTRIWYWALTRWTNLQAVVTSKSIHIQTLFSYTETTTTSYTTQSTVGLNWKDLITGAWCLSAEVISSLCVFTHHWQFNVSDCWYWHKPHCSSWGYHSLSGTTAQLYRFPFSLGSVCNSRCLEEWSKRLDQRRRQTTASCLIWEEASCLPHV